MYLLRIALPFRGSLISAIIGRLIGPQGSALISCSCMFLSAVISVVTFTEVARGGSPVSISIAPWFINSNWGLYFDALSSSMLMIVFVVSFVVHLFTSYYRSSDPHLQRFYSFLSLFTASRGILVSADNYLRLFLGWEWIGISSFLLICFWFTRIDAVKSALQALLYNRAGDRRFSMGLFFLIWSTASRDFGTIFAVSHNNTWNLVCILILFGAMAKSAQVPLHTWLPNSREGPTPVSSLLHAATLVTAGVYLLLRSVPLLINANEAQIAIASVGAITAFFAATTGLVQNDIKRIIAFSTCSQVGYMIAAAGMSMYDLSLFHLVNHAFFKALLFLGAGGVLHGLTNNQDIRYQGGALPARPITYTARGIGSLALVAFPFITGRYSKELIITSAQPNLWFVSLLVAAAFTAYYSMRLLYRTFFASPRFVSNHNEEVPYSVVLCYAILGLCSIFFGYLMHDAFIGPGSDRLGISSWYSPSHLLTEFNIFGGLRPILFTFAGIASYLSGLNFLDPSTSKVKVYSFLVYRWNIDEVASVLPIQSLNLSGAIRKVLDRGILELVGPRGLSESLYSLSSRAGSLDRRPVSNLAILILTLALALTLYVIPTYNHTSNILYPLAALLLVILPTITEGNDTRHTTIFNIPLNKSDLLNIYILPFLLGISRFT